MTLNRTQIQQTRPRCIKAVDELSPAATVTEAYYLKNIGILVLSPAEVYNMLDSTWTYYVNGLTREAKIKPDANFGQTPDQIYSTHISNHPITPSTAKNLDLSFYISDYLGNTRIVYKPIYDCTENRRQDVNEYMADYYPEVYPERSRRRKILREYAEGDREKFLTTQHERDGETGFDYRGARFYDSDIGRFLSLDPLATKFPSISPYNYVLGNPIILVDPDGKAPEDVIILTNPKGAFGLGHMAMLIGDDESGWTYISKDGRADNNGDGNQNGTMVTGGESKSTVRSFSTLEDALNDGTVKSYQQGYQIETTKEQDATMLKVAKESVKTDYNVLSNNCADACSKTLESVGKDGGGKTNHRTGGQYEPSTIPNERYNEIIENNPGGTTVKTQEEKPNVSQAGNGIRKVSNQ